MSTPAIILSSSALMCGEPPGLVEPKLILPGCALASASSSPSVLAGTLGCTTTMLGVLATTVTGAKSFTAS